MTHPSDDQTGYGTDPGAVVHEYLRSVRQLVAAERDVMLRYLGAEVPASGAYDHDAAPLQVAGPPLVALASAPVVQPASSLVEPASSLVEPASSLVEPVETRASVSTSSTSAPLVEPVPSLVEPVETPKNINVAGRTTARGLPPTLGPHVHHAAPATLPVWVVSSPGTALTPANAVSASSSSR